MNNEFKPITLECQDEFEKALAACPQRTSDFTFANIWGWTEHYGLEISCGKSGLIHVRQTKPEVINWAPIGDWFSADWEKCELMSTPGTKFTRIPEKLALHLKEIFGDKIEITENRDHFDYIYSVQELIELRGNRFHKKKNLYRQFMKKYDYEYREITPDCVEEVLEMQLEWYRWQEEKNFSPALVAENEAIAKVLKEMDTIKNLTGGTLRIDNRIIAYTIAEPLGEDTIVIHFEKGNTYFKGVYQAINQMFLENNASDKKFVNREQDLGEPGLRKAKESYNPVHFMKKYELVVL
ncbi:DUF2156 domain-containing protein [Maridesulfovibrio salexigens]|uniref:Phosphatidylglycerol lysyltransferase C-terminal domain-containing protein n=1 Tax=Maridesulfovibrio salexigens (strain ATCC 14822 / DSM 2638 / NCIMB 8403 / VKM B-1763) TaxID=526222 RepID=C6BX83_MARSD|nr:phosphatidylglycerol lysyltransferase domain-containing protein [Maridesulfovibrio salexigens]ACS80389.1 conserved hypothetical protein [Maridesulfovibrio salexigens DSM 2638]